MKRPMIAAAIAALILSLLMLKFSAFALAPLALICAALLVVCIIKSTLRDYAVIFVVLLAIMVSNLFVTTSKINKIAEISDAAPVRLSGVIVSEFYNNGKAYYTLKTDNQNETVPSNTSVSVYTKFAALSVGNRAEIMAYVRPIDSEDIPQNYSKGVYAKATISSVIREEKAENLDGLLARFRAWVTNVFYTYLSPDCAASVNALTVGDKYYLSNEFDTLVRRSGVSHIMVVSGMHLTLICGVLFKVLEALKIRKHLAVIPAAVFVFLFMGLCGFSMSVLRAGFMYFVLLASFVFIRRADPLNSLSVAVCLIIIANPFSIGSAAFTLSVASTAGIVIFSTPITDSIMKLLHTGNKIVLFIVENIAVTVAALLFTLPLSVYYFGAVSTVVIITNFLIGTAVNISLVAAAAALPFALIDFLEPVTNGIFVICELTTRYFNFIIEFFGSQPYAYVEVNKAFFIISYLAIIATFVIIKYIDIFTLGVKRCANRIRAGVKGKS